ncbi:hypothetical protein QYB59_001679 [Clostridium perfringens]|nr:hypothetical protein [Clostridium perfringens]
MEYKVKVDKEDLLNNKFLLKEFENSSSYGLVMDSFKKGSIVLIAVVLMMAAIVIFYNKTIISLYVLFVIFFMSILIYFLEFWFFILLRGALAILKKRNYIYKYSYLIGEFTIYIKENILIMDSKNRTLKINLKDSKIKKKGDTLTLIEKNGFLITLPVNKIENFEELKKCLIEIKRGGM